MRKSIWMRAMAIALGASLFVTPILSASSNVAAKEDAPIVLRICNWEEYIDEGDWDEEEAIDLEEETILGEDSVVDDFVEWFRVTYGREIEVEYSAVGTNEELYTQLTLGDVYDLICPSEYMMMKLISEDALQPLSEAFFDTQNELNYYTNGVSPYIQHRLEEGKIGDEAWAKYMAAYMWGTTGFVYNPEYVTQEDASTWELMINPEYRRRITNKDNIRDSYFPTMAILNKDIITDEEFIASPDYGQRLEAIMNDTSKESVDQAEALLKQIRENVYSFETDSGKADMVTGKVVANLQWSGDAVYTMDQADEDGVELYWTVPDECTNLWIDGWCMLKAGIAEDPDKQMAAEAFINFVSRPDIAIRNMYYIGYTSSIAGGEDTRMYEYLEWCYGAEDDEEDVIEYPVGYFFVDDNEDEDYILIAPADAAHRQLSAQYPTQDEIGRSAIMQYFDDEATVRVNQMWINIRCFNLSQITTLQWIVVLCVVLGVLMVIALSIVISRVHLNNRIRARRARENA